MTPTYDHNGKTQWLPAFGASRRFPSVENVPSAYDGRRCLEFIDADRLFADFVKKNLLTASTGAYNLFASGARRKSAVGVRCLFQNPFRPR
jgi:hypothetical protein